MSPSAIISLFKRDLSRLKEEILSYEQESDLWVIGGEITNSAGNLALHICGNLNHFIGATLGDTGYVRDRPVEFTEKNTPMTELSAKIDATSAAVGQTLEKITEGDWEKEFPIQMWNKSHTTGEMVIHFLGHLNYHLGQINYHRRLLAAAKK